jgi:hypothetical protein
LNPGHRGGKPGTNRLRYGTARFYTIKVKEKKILLLAAQHQQFSHFLSIPAIATDNITQQDAPHKNKNQ